MSNSSVSGGHVTDAELKTRDACWVKEREKCQSNLRKLRGKDEPLNLERELKGAKSLGSLFPGVRGKEGCPLKLQHAL